MDTSEHENWDATGFTNLDDNPSQSPGPPPMLITPHEIDSMVAVFQLEEYQQQRLHSLAVLGSLPPALSLADLGTRLIAMANTFDLFNRRNERGPGEANIDMNAIWKDLQIRLETTFALTKEQAANVQAVVKDVIYSPRCSSTITAHIPVLAVLEVEKVNLNLINIWGNPSRETKLTSAVKSTASSVRNNMRVDIIKHLEDGTSLVHFTAYMNGKYKRFTMSHGDASLSSGGEAVTPPLGYEIRNALWRHFCHLNPHYAVKAGQDEENDDVEADAPIDPAINQSDNSLTVDAILQTRGVPKKRKTTSGGKVTSSGKVSKKASFWGALDAWMAELHKQHGQNYTSPGWKVFIADVVRLDQNGFIVPKEPETRASSQPPANPATPATPATTSGFPAPTPTSLHSLGGILSAFQMTPQQQRSTSGHSTPH